MYDVRGYESNQYQEIGIRQIPGYEVYDDALVIHDPTWGNCTIGEQPGDEVLLRLLDNPLVRRSMAIEQLTLDATTATIPNTAQFSRWEHIWGSVAFVRKMTEGNADITDRERLILQLRTFVSDLGHTAYSHLGDWMFQGQGGPENQHDDELFQIMEVSGVNDVLRAYDVEPEEVIFPEGQDWIECSAPDLCVDRVDYGAREIQRWLQTGSRVSQMLRPESFSVVDGQLVMADRQTATIFGKAFLALATEHWSEPVHRLQLKLQEELVKRAIAPAYLSLLALSPLEYGSHHPRDLLYTVDSDITREMYRSGTFSNTVRPLMQEIGSAKRRIFTMERLGQLTTYLATDTDEYPNPLHPYAPADIRPGGIPLLPANISVIPVTDRSEVTDYGQRPDAVDFFLPALKARSVDPQFYDEAGKLIRVSQVDPNFAALRQQQAALLQQAYVARLHVNDTTRQILVSGMAENAVGWKLALQRQRMSTETFRNVLRDSVMVAAGSMMINLDWQK